MSTLDALSNAAHIDDLPGSAGGDVEREAAAARIPNVLLLSSSLLTDRMLQHGGVLEGLRGIARTTVWATSAGKSGSPEWTRSPGVHAAFPEIRPFREFPFNYLRRLNEFTWDFRYRPPSRLSMIRHVRNKIQPAYIRALQLPARLLALLRAEARLESWLERLLLTYPRSPEAADRIRHERPDVVVTTGPHRFEEPAVIAEAKKQGIPTLAFITSWDNISTKHRMVFGYDGYLVWSEQMKRELLQFYPASRHVPIYVVGAPQFDVFYQPRFDRTRQEYCESQGLRPELPIILYALGSPNFVREHHGALFMAERVARGDLGDVQLLVRPHPMFDNGREAELLRGFGSRVRVQRTGKTGTALPSRSQDESQITEWVNTFRHADVLVNLSSTTAVDAAICDCPIVNLDFDPEPGQPNQMLVRDVNHSWTHYKPIAESGGLVLVGSMEEMVGAVRAYLRQPEMHRDRRRWIAEHVCGFVDGKCGERMALAIRDFACHQLPATGESAR